MTPTPPEGYKLVKGEEIKDCVPEGALFSERGRSWAPSFRVGKNLRFPFQLDGDYAIPIQPEKPTHPESITSEAKSIVSGDRAAGYGDVNESFARIAGFWSTYKGVEFTPWDVAMMMILLKVSRAKTSKKRDTLVDISGYAKCASNLKP